MLADVSEDVSEGLTEILDRLHLRSERLGNRIAGSTKGLTDPGDRVLHPLSRFGPSFCHPRRRIVPELLNPLTGALDSPAKVLADGLADRENRI